MFLHPHRVPVVLADPPTVLYRLEGEYDYQEGCFGQCMCPVMLGQLEGTRDEGIDVSGAGCP